MTTADSPQIQQCLWEGTRPLGLAQKWHRAGSVQTARIGAWLFLVSSCHRALSKHTPCRPANWPGQCPETREKMLEDHHMAPPLLPKTTHTLMQALSSPRVATGTSHVLPARGPAASGCVLSRISTAATISLSATGSKKAPKGVDRFCKVCSTTQRRRLALARVILGAWRWEGG